MVLVFMVLLLALFLGVTLFARYRTTAIISAKVLDHIIAHNVA